MDALSGKMELKDFYYDLPLELIAQHPLIERDTSRLMVLKKTSGKVTHGVFGDIKEYLKAGDLLVLNDTKVIPSRITGTKTTGGRVELLLVLKPSGSPGSPGSEDTWSCMAKPAKGLRPGTKLLFDKGISAKVTCPVDDNGLLIVTFEGMEEGKSVPETLGDVPLPPYIRRKTVAEDFKRYQTVYADKSGAVAAPTAGLHFTEKLLAELKALKVEIRYITLHTGPGTFLPVRVDNIEEHKMLLEAYSIPEEVFKAIARAKKEGRRVVAAGTTTTRALEGAIINGLDRPVLSGTTDLFIYPGFTFKIVDALLTNFHLPCSTLIMLVAAFVGKENVLRAYKEAVKQKYRFFSYGDAMFIG
jgi:S-adenosylmethionine:tRNA ribosyltransferase-isomerase